MSIAPGMTFNAGNQIQTTQGAGQAADFISGGVGFMNNGRLALDSAAPAANANFDQGIAQNASGAYHFTTTPSASDTWIAGVRVSALGQLVIQTAAVVDYSNGQGITTPGRLAAI